MTTARETRAQRRRRRRLSAVITLVCGAIVAIAGLLINSAAGSPIAWYWLLAGPLYVSGLVAAFLWVRLTPG